MHDVLAVRKIERVQDTDPDAQSFSGFNAARAPQHDIERFPIDVLKDQKATAFHVLKSVNLDNVGMAECALPPAFIQESLLNFRLAREVAIEELDGRGHSQMDVASEP